MHLPAHRNGEDGCQIVEGPDRKARIFRPFMRITSAERLHDDAMGRQSTDSKFERFRIDELVRRVLRANGDEREVVVDSHARYFGAELDDQSLVASPAHALDRCASRSG